MPSVYHQNRYEEYTNTQILYNYKYMHVLCSCYRVYILPSEDSKKTKK